MTNHPKSPKTQAGEVHTSVAPQTCAECYHERNLDENGRCKRMVDGTYVAGIGLPCNCKCVFPARAESEVDESVIVNAASAIREYFGATADAGWTFEEISVCNEDIKAMVRTAVRTALTTNQDDTNQKSGG